MLLASAVPAISLATPLVIQNPYVQAGISDFGTLGSNSDTEPGILYDPTGSANYGSADFLTPGDPFEGFLIKSDSGTDQYSNNNEDTTFNAFTLTSLSATKATAVSNSTDGTLSVSNTYTLGTVDGLPTISISTTITNLSEVALTNVRFLRSLDPDPDSNTLGTTDTRNWLASATQACGAGPKSGNTVCLYSNDTAHSPKAGISSDWSTDPDDFLAGLNDGSGDNTLGVAFVVGNIAAGGSATLTYAYSFSVTSADVPAPTLGLGALGVFVSMLLAVAWVERKRLARLSNRSISRR